MKRCKCISREIGLALMLLVFSSIGALGAINHSDQSQTITYEQAQEKKNFWQTHGFPQYVPEQEGYKVILSCEQEQMRIDALREFVDHVTPAIYELDTESSLEQLVQRFDNQRALSEEARRLGIDESILSDIVNRLKSLIKKSQLKVQIENGDILFFVCIFEALNEEGIVVTLILFILSDLNFTILHVPISRLCSSMCESSYTNAITN